MKFHNFSNKPIAKYISKNKHLGKILVQKIKNWLLMNACKKRAGFVLITKPRIPIYLLFLMCWFPFSYKTSVLSYFLFWF